MLDWYNSKSTPPDGVYFVKIISIHETFSKNGNPMWVFSLAFKDTRYALNIYQVVDGNFDKPNTKSIIRARLSEMAVCFSVTPPGNTPDDWINHTGYIQIATTTNEDGNERSTVKNFFNPQTGKAKLFTYQQQLEADKFFSKTDDEFSDEIQSDSDPAPKPKGQSVNKNWNPVAAEPFDPETGF